MNGIDCATKLTASSAQALKEAGIEVVGRYLGRTMSKGLTKDEAQIIYDAGLKLFLIWELNPTKASYFSYDKGVSDAKNAVAEAEDLGIFTGSVTIYFTVDFDAQPENMAVIKDYFYGVHVGLGGKYYTGAYGSYSVLESLKGASYPPDKFYQTYAWSNGQKTNCHIYQYSNDITLVGLDVDKDYVNEDAGLWGQEDQNNNQEEEEPLDHAVMYFTVNDFSIAKVVADKLGGCAMFCRNANNTAIHAAAKSAKHLVVIGGAEVTDHSNVTNCCGESAEDTAILAAKYAQTL